MALISSKRKIEREIRSGEYLGNNEEEITIPGYFTRIRSYAFEDCPNLTTVYCPKSLTRIDENAFYNCPNLKRVILEEIGQKVSLRITADLDTIKSGSSFILGDSVRKGYPIEIDTEF